MKEGLVTVRTIAGSKDPVLQHLTELQEQAKAAKKGKWADDASVRFLLIYFDIINFIMYIFKVFNMLKI